MHLYLGVAAALLGLWTSVTIYKKKRAKTKLVCPLQSNCDKVIGSRFGTTLGISNELLGIVYYIFMGSLYACMLLFPALQSGWMLYSVLVLTIAGIFFSAYLVSLQVIVIRAWCAWCLLSVIATILLAIALTGFHFSEVFLMLQEQRVGWIIAHNIGFILGLGGATITDIFFFRFLKDNVISEEEKGTMDTLTSVIWVGIAILVISGLMLYLPEQARLAVSSKFLLKVVVVGVIIVNGFLLNMLVAPRMRHFSFEGTLPAARYRRLSFALGGVSIVSWYSAFLLGSLRSIPLSFSLGILLYGIVLVGVIIGSQVFERIAVKAHRTSV